MSWTSPEVWIIDLQKYWHQEDALMQYLDLSERQRACRFKFDYLRRNYIVSHAFFRFLIAHYLQISPQEVSFCYGPHGKPFIRDKDFHFNMSHSHQRAIYAFSCIGEVGIDIEYINPKVPIEQLPFSIFPIAVQKEIRSYPYPLQRELFYKNWVRMEAYLKAEGLGLSCGQSQTPSFSKWRFYDVPLSDGYVGGVVYKASLSFANASLEHPIPKIKDAMNIEIPPTNIGIL